MELDERNLYVSPGTAAAATFKPWYAEALKERSLIPPVSVTSQARNELFALAVRPWVAAKLGVAPLTSAMLVARTTADSVAVGRSQPHERDFPVRSESSLTMYCLPFLLSSCCSRGRAVAGLR